MERTFPVAPEKVFAFITKTQNLLQWWGPEGTRIEDHALDFSKLGPWSATMISPQGATHTVGGEVIAIEPPNFVELTLSFIDENGSRGPESCIRFEVKYTDTGETLLQLTQTGLEEKYIADMRNKGWVSALTRLEKLILEN